MIRKFILSFLLTILFIAPNAFGAQPHLGHKIHAVSKRLFVGGGDFSWDYCDKKLLQSILVMNSTTGEKIGQIQFENTIRAYDVHPSGRIGIVDARSVMRVYDVDLTLLATIQHVVTGNESIYFDWNVTGDKLVYLAVRKDGEPPSEDAEVADYRVAYIYDIKTHTTEKIVDCASSIRWAKHDGNIYYKIPLDSEADYGVYKYNPFTKATTKTSLLGVEFSADGVYYVGSRTEGEEETPYNLIYRTADNKVVSDSDVDVEKVYELGEYNHFLGNSHKVLTRWDAPTAIFDADQRTYSRLGISNSIIGWSDDDSLLIIAEKGCKVRIENALTGQVVKELTIDPAAN